MSSSLPPLFDVNSVGDAFHKMLLPTRKAINLHYLDDVWGENVIIDNMREILQKQANLSQYLMFRKFTF